MSEILIPGKNAPHFDPKRPNLPQQPAQVKAVPVFQNRDYTILRHTEAATVKNMLDLPLHLIQIACGLLNADNYVPKVGKEGFLRTMKALKKGFDEVCKVQTARARGMVEEKPELEK